MPISTKKLSAQPVVPALLPGDRLPVLRRAADEPAADKRNPTVGAQAVADWLAPYLGEGITELQINSETGKRTAVVKLVQPLSLLSVVALAANNVQAYALQVNTYATNWQAGPARASLPTAQADLDALTSSQYAAGAELEVTTTAVDDTAEAILILSFRA